MKRAPLIFLLMQLPLAAFAGDGFFVTPPAAPAPEDIEISNLHDRQRESESIGKVGTNGIVIDNGGIIIGHRERSGKVIDFKTGGVIGIMDGKNVMRDPKGNVLGTITPVK